MSAASSSTIPSYVAAMTLAAELERIAVRAGADAVLAAEPHTGERIYVCAFEEGDGGRTWLAFDREGEPIAERQRVRDAVSIVALCELAEETAAGGDLDELRSQLAALRVTENPDGIEEAEEAALELQRVLGAPPTLATPARLDEIGAATRQLEVALGGAAHGSPFVAAMKGAGEVVEALFAEVAGLVPDPAQLTSEHGRRRFRRLPVRRRSRGSAPRPARVRRAAGRVGAGGPARAVRDADAEHRGRADGGRAEAGAAERRDRRAGDRAPRRDARALPRGGGARRAQPARASCKSVRLPGRVPARPRRRHAAPGRPEAGRADALLALHRRPGARGRAADRGGAERAGKARHRRRPRGGGRAARTRRRRSRPSTSPRSTRSSRTVSTRTSASSRPGSG